MPGGFGGKRNSAVESGGLKQNKRPSKSLGAWQGKHDSNMQPTVLETATLPLSYSPMKFSFISI